MELTQLTVADANSLPYFITDFETGSMIPVCFKPLAADDEVELRGEIWSNAVFAAVWPQLAGDEDTLKLVFMSSHETQIQGLVRTGKVMRRGEALMESLLEASPANQYKSQERRYQGVGRVLIARLIVESWRHGGQGKVIVRARPDTETFYRSIGFTSIDRFGNPSYFILDGVSATALLRAVLLPESE